MIRKLACLLLLVSAPAVVFAQSVRNSSLMAYPQGEAGAAAVDEPAESPVAEVRNARSWEIAPFLNWGKGVGDRSDFNFLWGGVEVGKTLTPVLKPGPGFLSGQLQLAGNIMPLWLAFTPAPHLQTFKYKGATYIARVGGGTYYGVSLTPVILRWNFLTKSKRVQPWFQGAGGLIYTTHKFPPDVLIPHGTPGATSVWNFSPQGGVGIHYFLRSRRSIDLGVNAVHISSASLGDHNPGVNASIQIQVGYTVWK
ncbi:acyloxyacyl hydrolase [Acidobacteria bacterium AB60]|nr:acyloxyacyl hydrolase [Acidobacteria bacterium AB60]